VALRTKVKEILQMEDDLTEIVQLVGKDSLGESEKITLEIARIIRDDFLQQNGFTAYDRMCPFFKTVWMLRNIVLFYSLAQKAVEQASVDRKVTWNQIRSSLSSQLYQLTRMKFQDPHDGEAALVANFKALYDDINNAFRNLGDE